MDSIRIKLNYIYEQIYLGLAMREKTYQDLISTIQA